MRERVLDMDVRTIRGTVDICQALTCIEYLHIGDCTKSKDSFLMMENSSVKLTGIRTGGE